MVEVLAGRMAASIKRQVPEHPASEAVLRFGLSLVLNAVFTVVLAVVLGLAFGVLPGTLLALLSFAALRAISGGYHFHSSTTCIIVSASAACIFAHFHFTDFTVLMMNAVNVLLAVIFAPSDIDKQTNIPRKFYPLLKAAAVAIVSLNFIIGSSVLAATFALQCMSLWIKRRR